MRSRKTSSTKATSSDERKLLPPKKTLQTSWDNVAQEYHSIVGTEGHFYHREVIIPNLKRLLNISIQDSFLDLGCGQGVFEKIIPQKCRYLGIDLSYKLLKLAQKERSSSDHIFTQADLTESKNLETFEKYKEKISKAVAILSLQNMEHPEQAIRLCQKLLKPGGIFVIVLNHPCFRIPRLSSWHYNESKKIVSRKIDRYLSSQKIPISNNPGKKNSAITWSFHFPLSHWVSIICSSNLSIIGCEEWISPKSSYGKRGKSENLARKEFPLFLALKCQKQR